LAIGLLLVVAAVLLLIENLTDWSYTFSSWWPTLIVLIGVLNLIRRRSGRWFWALITIISVALLLDSVGLWEINLSELWRLWPVILLLVGVQFIFGVRRSRSRRRKPDKGGTDDLSSPEIVELDKIQVSGGFGSTQQKVTSSRFVGGTVSTVFGTAAVDLGDAGLEAGPATLDVSAIFGRVTLVVPHNWSVERRITNLVGGAEDVRTHFVPEEGHTLRIKGTCLFGGITIQSPARQSSSRFLRAV